MDPIVWKISAQLALFVLLIVAAVTDLIHRKVYDWLTLPAMVVGLSLAFLEGGLEQLWSHFALGLFPAVLIFGFFVYSRQMGGGDLKLMAAIGAIKGPFVFQALFWTSLVGAILGLGTLIWHGRFLSGLGRAVGLAAKLKAPEAELVLNSGAASRQGLELGASVEPAAQLVELGPASGENISGTELGASSAIPVGDGAAAEDGQGADFAEGPKTADEVLSLRVPYGVAIAFGTFFAWFLQEFGRPL